MPTELPVIMRPNGKPYRPRKLITYAWDDQDFLLRGVVVFGTHDVATARPLALEWIRYWYGCDHAVDPRRVWWHDGIEGGERRWMDDGVRGRAGLVFTASDDPPAPDVHDTEEETRCPRS